MCKIVTSFFVVIFTLNLSAQFVDDFSDSNFSHNPTWTGQDSLFIVNTDLQLQLKDTSALGTAYLSSQSKAIENAHWQFLVQLGFNPSSANLARVYLVADRANLSADLNGYFVEIGSSSDAVSLYRQDGNRSTKIIEGKSGRLNTSTVHVRVEVFRDKAGKWELYADTSGAYDFVLEAKTLDSSYYSSAFFGVYCKYTSTRSEKFFFDDFIVNGQPYIDTLLPKLEQISLLSDSSLRLKFSESMDSSALLLANYSLNKGIGNPKKIVLLQSNNAELELEFRPFSQNGIYTLSFSNLKDLAGNPLLENSVDFEFYTAEANDVIISEIMADPSPSVALPEEEYLEIYNRSNKPLNLKNWVFESNGSKVLLPDYLLKPNSYLTLAEADSPSLFHSYGEVLELERLPQLTNSAGKLLLISNYGKVIDRVSYSESWYQSTLKQAGGWSLEIIDINNLCGAAENWAASKDAKGGSPGQLNSISAHNPDEIAPILKHIVYEFHDTLNLYFDSPLDEASVFAGAYSFSPSELEIKQINWTAREPEMIQLILQERPEPKQIYTLSCKGISDCMGNEIGAFYNFAAFGIPEKAESKDVLINEILFNPYTGGSDFVELYNFSTKVIELRDLIIARAPSGLPEEIDAFAYCSEQGFQLLPNDFVVLTDNPENISANYTVEDARKLLQVKSMPNYLNSDGIVALLRKDLEPIDQVQYSDDWHFPLLKSLKGVSLERINYARSSQDKNNWHSAAEKLGFSTPGRENSNYSANFSTTNQVQIEPKLFSPDGDGYKDFLQIRYQFDAPGYVASIRIFDSEGRPIKNLANNKLLEAKGYLTWDGTNDAQNKASIGAYILIFEVFEPNGNSSKFKKSCILGGQLD